MGSSFQGTHRPGRETISGPTSTRSRSERTTRRSSTSTSRSSTASVTSITRSAGTRRRGPTTARWRVARWRSRRPESRSRSTESSSSASRTADRSRGTPGATASRSWNNGGYWADGTGLVFFARELGIPCVHLRIRVGVGHVTDSASKGVGEEGAIGRLHRPRRGTPRDDANPSVDRQLDGVLGVGVHDSVGLVWHLPVGGEFQ